MASPGIVGHRGARHVRDRGHGLRHAALRLPRRAGDLRAQGPGARRGGL